MAVNKPYYRIYRPGLIYFSAEDSNVDVRSFKVIPYQIPEAEKYDFVWEDIKTDPNRFQRFQFN